jgi:hypothetical protein
MPTPTRPIDRSGRSILSFQLQCLCNTLRIAVQAGQPAGAANAALQVKLPDDMLSMVSGRCVDSLPEINVASPAELLAHAEVLNETPNAFLSPEEGEEKRKVFGFDRVALAFGPLRVGWGRQQRE